MLPHHMLSRRGCLVALAAPLLAKDITEWTHDPPSKPSLWTLDGSTLTCPGKTVNLVSKAAHGDIDLSLDFLIPAGSNSGVYLHGLYEVQIIDTFGKTELNPGDSGGIYSRWIDGKTVGGSAPKVNAARKPGEWQSMRIKFRAPKFDAQGRKTANARFDSIVYNGQLIQENVEVDGGTRSHMAIPEAARNPLMLQGDHGQITFRHVNWKPLS